MSEFINKQELIDRLDTAIKQRDKYTSGFAEDSIHKIYWQGQIALLKDLLYYQPHVLFTFNDTSYPHLNKKP